MTKDSGDMKTLCVRVPKETWSFLKIQAAAQEISMTEIILRCIDKYKKKFDSKLTQGDINI